ncbi:MAG: hypothetical protein ABW321_33440 [Polyangiales bacterium]
MATGITAATAQAPAPLPGTPSQTLLRAYLDLQTKLAQDDQAGAHTAFVRVQAASVDKGLALDAALQKRLEGAANQGVAASKIEPTRVAFGALSEVVLAYLRTVDNPLSHTLVVAHCPMAFDNKGAKWLQLGDKLRNPYFGSEMLTCGSAESSVKPGKKL